MYLDKGAEIRLVEIGLLESCRRKGIGSYVVGIFLSRRSFRGRKCLYRYSGLMTEHTSFMRAWAFARFPAMGLYAKWFACPAERSMAG